ncbi:AAA family ATPase [Solirubrobacter sp. CPCC 204708]|uniref:LuxR C-terminal-related transcriptional regulator n=1 Tax=Solirubrobacter deserti TaxID=2282478 RepID=A0ABT4RKJ3_9ACTN|nr:LuxR family transcriptional regulator [Solirubrobacter deserti]MBE2315803.1 AAA family ATPase [Solirubrobacter deserti]MDA0138861.1 LuxR C-terminal-related transcriptional regulator [Solirubrobacter deserti]
MPSEAFVGRTTELGDLGAALARSRAGSPQVVLVAGAAGMGKTALLDRFLRDAGDAILVRAEGVESEVELEFGIVDQLLQRGVGGDHLEAGRELLDRLDQLESEAPVILAVEDAHWVDAGSLRAILFAVRRLVAERVLTVLTVRADELDRLPPALRALATGARGSVVTVEALSEAEVEALAAASGITLSRRVARALQTHTAGSPLYLKALLDEQPAERWSVDDGTWPAPRSYAALVHRRVAAAPAPGRRLLEALAVAGPVHAAAIAGVDALEAADAALATGLVTFADRTLRFGHPLSRAAVYHGLGVAERARLHARAAELADSPAIALRHRVAAAVGTDDVLAEELERSAAEARARGSWPAVATALHTASRLSADAAARERRLLEATEATLYGSDRLRARRLLPQVEALEPSALRDGVLAFVAIALGQGDQAEALLASAWAQCDTERDPVLAAKLAERRAYLAVLRMRGHEIVEWGRRALAHAPDNDVTVPLATWSLVLGLDLTGRGEEAWAVVEASIARLGARLAGGGYPLADVTGSLLLASDRAAEAREHLAVAAPPMVRHGLLTPGALTYARLARAQFLLGEWDEAVVNAELAVAVANEAMDPASQVHALQVAMLVPAARGQRDEVEGHMAALEQVEAVFESHVAARRIGLAYGAAEPARVLAELEPLVTAPGSGDADDPGYFRWHDVYVEALLDTGALDAAADFLAVWEPSVTRAGMRANLARARGRLAWLRRDRDGALRALAQAQAVIAPLEYPYEQARIALEHGKVLRRDGQRRAATAQLLAAKAAFEALGAAPWIAQCNVELEACGVALSPDGRRGSRDELTPRERAVERLAAAGRTNREIAAELMLSVKTVENHLTHVFAKRGVRSRAEL